MAVIQIEEQSLFYKWQPADAQDGPVILLIHGLGSSHSFYASVTPGLLSHGYSCLSLDTPGSGLSKYGGQDKSPKAIAQIISALVSKLDLDYHRIVVVGHSMGSMIASEIALQHPVLGVVLVGPVHPAPSLGTVFAGRIKTVEKEGLEPLADSIPVAATGSKSNSLQHAFIRALILAQSAEGYMSLCRTIANAEAPAYDKIQSPLCIVAGSDDKTSPISGCHTIMQSWGGGKTENELTVLDGVGHWHCVEAPDLVRERIIEFVKSLKK